MAGHVRYTALLDACVLFPIALADSLMSLATAGLFAAKWTRRIEQEWITNLEEHRPDLTGRLSVRRDGMREAIPDWEVNEQAWAPLVGNMGLPDPDDQHVLAAAIAGHADCIVTANLRDFPAEIVGIYGIEVIHPDHFIINQWDLEPIAAMSAFKAMRARWKKPSATPEDFAQVFDRNGLPATAQRIREAAALI
ncbi:PIN domain-containing protein [Burkholderia sp. Cy-637]|uniref:PIN domain-containing protein n=1 Tax=Burkholderia sp. Cy-637 TaxID=2608327 RepID=UPI00141F35F9|nr:PIN domain-containing protein [Burkholderia sp. Cy-637]NIF88345.1 PIN domain-containing protein [Burkholderia sp. Cy-637]